MKDFDFYIAGAMRNCLEHNRPAFKKWTKYFRDKGYHIFSPEEVNAVDMNFADCMFVDLNTIINKCGGVIVINGWRQSLGVNIELFTAFVLDKPVFEIQENGDLKELDLSNYRLPYSDCNFNFDPHVCELHEFGEAK